MKQAFGLPFLQLDRLGFHLCRNNLLAVTQLVLEQENTLNCSSLLRSNHLSHVFTWVKDSMTYLFNFIAQ